jgi:hypothetical protein
MRNDPSLRNDNVDRIINGGTRTLLLEVERQLGKGELCRQVRDLRLQIDRAIEDQHFIRDVLR